MPRPVIETITFTVDGKSVKAPAGAMLADAAKLGGVDIPVFCYEPKLGAPVGACRMCLVEVEGIPKLQTACSTPVRDGMVVDTQSERVKSAQNSVVEFLLLNHPLDCPVCDKGGECPLQDISFGWGRGESRMVEPKRHFEKPVELSPLIAIDRERCILCYRCVRFSQEVSEDYQLFLHERGAATFVGTFDERPYVSPFSGNITELCPVGALTSQSYRFRARPWDIEQSGSVCTLCPAGCNVSYTVRDDRVQRVITRDNDDVDDGWLCDVGRYGFQSAQTPARITQPLVRNGHLLLPASWEDAFKAAAKALSSAGSNVAALAGKASNEEAFLLQKLLRETLGSSHLDSGVAAAIDPQLVATLDDPRLSATVSDLEFATTVLLLGCEPINDMPILDLRIRKGVRRNNVKLLIASDRPSSLDSVAKATLRFTPGQQERFLIALDAAIGGATDAATLATQAGIDPGQLEEVASQLRGSGQEIVIVWGEQLLDQQLAAAENSAKALLKIAGRLGLGEGKECTGLLQVPAVANGRGLREVGFKPQLAAGLAAATNADGSSAEQIRQGLLAGELRALYLFGHDPVVERKAGAEWDEALHAASAVVAHAQHLTPGIAEHATVVFPLQVDGEIDGTVTHPDGRLQRLRTAVSAPVGVRAGWQLIAALDQVLGGQAAAVTSMVVTKQLSESVPFYNGITLNEIGGQGVRWQQREAASNFPGVLQPPFTLSAASTEAVEASSAGSLTLGTFKSVWAGEAVALSPALAPLAAQQVVEVSPGDAQALQLAHGDLVTVSGADQSPEARSVQATVRLRSDLQPGVVFMQNQTADGQSATKLGLLDGAKVQLELLPEEIDLDDEELSNASAELVSEGSSL